MLGPVQGLQDRCLPFWIRGTFPEASPGVWENPNSSPWSSLVLPYQPHPAPIWTGEQLLKIISKRSHTYTYTPSELFVFYLGNHKWLSDWIETWTNQISSPGAPKKQESQNWLAALQKIELMETPTWVWGDLDKGNTSWYFDPPSFSQDTDAAGCTSNRLLLILITPGQMRWGRRQGRWEGTHMSHRWRTSPAEIPTNRDFPGG